MARPTYPKNQARPRGLYVYDEANNLFVAWDGISRIGDGTDTSDVEALADTTDNLDGKNGLVTASGIYGRISSTAVRPIKADGSTHSLCTVDYEHCEIHSGSHYFVTGYQDLANGNVLDFTWQMPNTTKWIHWTWEISTESETNWFVYENVVATNPLANSVTPINSNRNSSNTSGTTLKYEKQTNLTAANADTNVAGATLLESGISGAGKDAGDDRRNNELVLKQNTLYCLRAIASAAGFINFKLKFYEHTSKD